MPELVLGALNITVEQKAIKNIHLSVYPPDGAVRIAAPAHIDLDIIRVFALSKLRWIKQQQATFQVQQRETPRAYIERESHYFQGERYLLHVIERSAKPEVCLQHSSIELYVRPNTSVEQRKVILDNWYRAELKKMVPELLAKWERKIGVKAHAFGIKKMRTKWGSCNIEAKRIWLNLELAKKPLICLEYILVHELVHLLERQHNDRFVRYMNTFMPGWPSHRDVLNQLPFSHVEWKY